jgi:hypothetical protein
MNPAHQIRGFRRYLERLSQRAFSVANLAIRVMTPILVTGHTLPVIRAAQTGLTQIVRVVFGAVALVASGWSVIGIVMMANHATIGHGFHGGVFLVGKNYRAIKIGQFVYYDYVGDGLRRFD